MADQGPLAQTTSLPTPPFAKKVDDLRANVPARESMTE
jgi:hypothetical protein